MERRLIMSNLVEIFLPVINSAFSSAGNKFADFIIEKYTGQSRKILNAISDIEADKVKSRWELIEKPLWLQAEEVKIKRQYENFGNVLIKATQLVSTSENKVSEDNDVFWGFLEHSKEISNSEMQNLLAKIIAGEYNKPGSYSMCTLQIVKMLGKDELKLFERTCSLLVNNEMIPQTIFLMSPDVLKFMNDLQIDFGSLQTLQNLSLFLPNTMIRTIERTEKKDFRVIYFDKVLNFFPENESFQNIRLPSSYNISFVGEQILKHLNPIFNEEYYFWLKSNFKIPNYIVSEEPK